MFTQSRVALKKTMCCRTPRVHDTLWYPFVVKVGELFTQDEVFKQRRAAQSGLERILVVGNRHTLVGGEDAPG